MKIRNQDGPPEDLLYFDEDLDLSQNKLKMLLRYLRLLSQEHITGITQLQTTELKNFMN